MGEDFLAIWNPVRLSQLSSIFASAVLALQWKLVMVMKWSKLIDIGKQP